MKQKDPPRRRLEGPIHDRIIKLRKKLGLTQEQLAQKIGVHTTAVSHWEKRFARPDQGRLAAVAAALGVTVDVLIRGEEAA